MVWGRSINPGGGHPPPENLHPAPLVCGDPHCGHAKKFLKNFTDITSGGGSDGCGINYTDPAVQAKEVRELSRRYLLGRDCLVAFRSLFFPARGDVPPAEFHYRWSQYLLQGERNIAIEGCRESAKTQYVMRAFPLHCLVYPAYDLDFIALISADEDTATDKLRNIRIEYESSKILSSNLVAVLESNEEAYEVAVMPYPQTDGAEPINVRIAVFGKGSAIRGLESRSRRPKIIILDDVQGKKDVESDNLLRKDWKWFLGDVMFLGEQSRVFMIGNNLGEKCLIEQVFAQGEKLGFETERVTALDPETESVSAWPQKFSAEKLLAERGHYQEMGELDVWYRERMCKAVSPEDQRFKKEMFRYYDPAQIPKGMNVYVTVDLAISQNKRSDYTCVCTVGVTKDNHWFVLDMDYGRWKPDEIMDSIFRAAAKWKPLTVGWEKVAFQAVIGHLIEREMPVRGIFFRSKGLMAERRKELRIEMMAPRFAAGCVWFPRGAGFLTELENELVSFPTGIHDDLIDALAYVEQLALVPGEWGSNDKDIPVAGAM